MQLLQIAGTILVAFAFCAFAEKVRYDNYKVYTLNVSTTEQLEQLRQLEQQNRYDFWSLSARPGDASNIMVAPHQAAEFADLVESLRLESELSVENVQKLIDEENPPSNGFNTAFNWNRYQSLDEINAWLNSRLAQYPGLLSNINIGQTTEGRTMRVIRLSARAKNPVVFVESNIHSNEWITSATSTWLLNELLTATTAEMRNLAQTIDWYFLIVANPDGFVHTHSVDRLWRKTRSATGNPLCRGVDPNRNFNFHWNQGGAGTNACSVTFAGRTAFSEPETRNIRDFYQSIARRTRLYLALHAYGQYVLLPYGHTTAPAHNHNTLMAIGNAGVQAFRQRFGTSYIIGSVANVMYMASGSSSDFAFGVHNTPLTYTVELRDIRNGPHGFILPAAQIIPNNLEFMDGLRAMIRTARQLNQL